MPHYINVIYPSRNAAVLALKANRRSGAHRRRETNLYPCWACKGWHLTSKRVGASWKRFQIPAS